MGSAGVVVVVVVVVVVGAPAESAEEGAFAQALCAVLVVSAKLAGPEHARRVRPRTRR